MSTYTWTLKLDLDAVVAPIGLYEITLALEALLQDAFTAWIPYPGHVVSVTWEVGVGR